MRYFGISLLRMLASATIALWPDVPTGGVPQRISLGCCARPDPAVASTDATAQAARTRVSMAVSPSQSVVLNDRDWTPAIEALFGGAPLLDAEGLSLLDGL